MKELDENKCPLCRGQNLCQAQSEKGCWCVGLDVRQGLLDLVPESMKGKACICQSCIERYNLQALSEDNPEGT